MISKAVLVQRSLRNHVYPEKQFVDNLIPDALTEFPSGMMIDDETGLIEWTPGAGDAGTRFVTATVTDGEFTVSQRFSLSVRTNAAPAIAAISHRSIVAGKTFTLLPAYSDPDGDPLIYTLSDAPAGMTIDAHGRLRWATAPADVDDYTVEITATDPFGATAVRTFELAVTADTVDPLVEVLASPTPVRLGETLTILVAVMCCSFGIHLATIRRIISSRDIVHQNPGARQRSFFRRIPAGAQPEVRRLSLLHKVELAGGMYLRFNSLAVGRQYTFVPRQAIR